MRRPSRAWTFEVDKTDPRAVSLSDKRMGIQIVVRWADNRSRLPSRRAAAVIESKLMGGDSSTGRRFSIPHRCTLGGEAASAFTVENVVAERFLHRTEYVVAARDEHVLVVAVSAGDESFDKRRKEIDAFLASITFLTPSSAAAEKSGASAGHSTSAGK